MKKIALLFITVCSIIIMAFSAYAMSYSEWYYDQFGDYPDGTVLDWPDDPVYWEYLNEYDPAEAARLRSKRKDDPVIGDHAWIIDAQWSGKTAKWTVEGSASKYEVRLYRDGKKVTSTTTTKKSVNFTDYITKDDDYWFEVRPYSKGSKTWESWVSSEEKYFHGSGSNPSGPSYGTNGWVQSPGGWQYYENGNPVSNRWILYANNWYRFDSYGTMMTGWQWIDRKCYYLNPNPNGGPIPYGACWMNGTTPDGYTVNASGAWVVDGVEQIR